MKITKEDAVNAAFDRAIADADAEEIEQRGLRTMAEGLATPPPSVESYADPQPRKRYTLNDPVPDIDNLEELYNYVQDTAQERKERGRAEAIATMERMTSRHKAHEAAVEEMLEKAFPPKPDDPIRAAMRKLAKELTE